MPISWPLHYFNTNAPSPFQHQHQHQHQLPAPSSSTNQHSTILVKRARWEAQAIAAALGSFSNPRSSNNNSTCSLRTRNLLRGQTKSPCGPGRAQETPSSPIALHYRLPAQSRRGVCCTLRTEFAVSSSSFTHWHCSDSSVQLHENTLFQARPPPHRTAPHPRPTHGRFSTKLSSLTRQLLLPPLAPSSYSDSRPKA
ncbi:hypothetical protein N431DRAFT_163976 [Stipitochalara longipes BDJ]|nr:hypothetical protein N431DRAFT_163976 [Stipitochalara longipes BDJ]